MSLAAILVGVNAILLFFVAALALSRRRRHAGRR
jgi:hypothetical protein